MARIIQFVLAGLLALAMATPSSAADLPRKDPIYTAPVFTWGGVYVGINGGYGWGTSDWSSAVTAGSPKPRGGLLGGTLGYNVQTGGLVWGLEADLDYSWAKGTDTAGIGVCAAPGCETRNTYLATGRGRLGFAADRWLPYITGGAALGGVKMSPNNGLSQTKGKFGWTLGGGVEYAVTGAWSIKAEYLYVDLGRTTCSAATCGIDTDVKFKDNVVRTGLNYRF